MIRSLVKICSEFFLLVIAPSFCLHCRAFFYPLSKLSLCKKCLDLIKPIPIEELRITPLKSIRIFALSAYENPLMLLIRAKNHGNILASRQLGLLMSSLLPDACKGDYLIPIPLHWARYGIRGFNQAEEIAKVLSKAWNIPVVSVLKRNKRTKLQSRLKASSRFGNLENAFTLDYTIDLKGKRLMLVDDLMTTGATLGAAGKALLTADPVSINAVVACRALRA
jgi:ComF family protein